MLLVKINYTSLIHARIKIIKFSSEFASLFYVHNNHNNLQQFLHYHRFGYFTSQLFWYYAHEYPIIFELFLLKLQPIILKVILAH